MTVSLGEAKIQFFYFFFLGHRRTRGLRVQVSTRSVRTRLLLAVRARRMRTGVHHLQRAPKKPPPIGWLRTNGLSVVSTLLRTREHQRRPVILR